MSNQNNIRLRKESNLIQCIKLNVVTESILPNYKILDGVAMDHLLKPSPLSRFIDNVAKIFSQNGYIMKSTLQA